MIERYPLDRRSTHVRSNDGVTPTVLFCPFCAKSYERLTSPLVVVLNSTGEPLCDDCAARSEWCWLLEWAKHVGPLDRYWGMGAANWNRRPRRAEPGEAQRRDEALAAVEQSHSLQLLVDDYVAAIPDVGDLF